MLEQSTRLYDLLEKKLMSSVKAQKALSELEAEHGKKEEWTEYELVDMMSETLDNYGYDAVSEPSGLVGVAPVVI